MTKYETHEVHVSELIKHYIANLPTPEGWQILAIDLFTDVLVLKRELPEKEVKEDSVQNGSPDALRNAEAMQTYGTLESQLNQKQTAA